jgi:hypothetical protein
MSLRELESAAEEAGIDRALVRRAASEVAVGGARVPVPEPKGQLAVEVQVEGEVSEDVREQLVGEARRALGEVGHVDVLGSTTTWHTNLHGLEIAVRGGQTSIRLTEKTVKLAADTFGPWFGLGGVMGSAILAGTFAALELPIAAAVCIPLWIGLVAVSAVRFYRRRVAERRRQLEATLSNMASLASASGSSAEDG